MVCNNVLKTQIKKATPWGRKYKSVGVKMEMFCSIVLLRDCNRNTALGITSLALLSGGVPPSWPGVTLVLTRGYPCPDWGIPPVLGLGTPGRTWNRTFHRTSDRTRGYPLQKGPGTRGWEGTKDWGTPHPVNRQTNLKHCFPVVIRTRAVKITALLLSRYVSFCILSSFILNNILLLLHICRVRILRF